MRRHGAVAVGTKSWEDPGRFEVFDGEWTLAGAAWRHYPWPVRRLTALEDTMVIQFGHFTLDGERRQLFRDDRALHLTPKAFDLLVLLATHAPRVVTKRELHGQLWPGTFISDATLTGLVKELRRVLDDHSRATQIIRTAHRVGYAFCPPIETVTARRTVPDHWLVLRGRRVALRDGEHVIGRDAARNIGLDDVSVSRRHARLVIEGQAARIEDLDSKNGTTVGGKLLVARVALHSNDRLAFGSVVAVYRSSDAGMSTETRSRSHLTSRQLRAPDGGVS